MRSLSYGIEKIGCRHKPWVRAGLVLGILVTQTAGAAPLLSWQLVRQMPHDPSAYTEGLLITPHGLYESTGLYGSSSLRLVEPATGKIVRLHALDSTLFGEGLALVNDRLIQLTWKEGRALIYARDTLQPISQWSYEGEGWGLTYDGKTLIMSDGSAKLTRRDPDSFAVLGQTLVRDGASPVARLNELEYQDGILWANIYMTDRIARIDPGSGRVSGYLDMHALRQRLPPSSATAPQPEVLNGVAATSGGTLLVTGKFWPVVFEIRLETEEEGGL